MWACGERGALSKRLWTEWSSEASEAKYLKLSCDKAFGRLGWQPVLDYKKAIELTEKYFGSIPAGPAVSKMKSYPAALTENKYISYEDNIKFPLIAMACFVLPE